VIKYKSALRKIAQKNKKNAEMKYRFYLERGNK